MIRTRHGLRHLLFFLAATAMLAMPIADAGAQAYPTRPITTVIPFAPGSGMDVIVRLVGTKLSDVLGQGFVIDNRAGAGGLIGSDYVIRAAPDGYTLLVTNNFGINQAFSTKPSIDVIKDFTPIIVLATTPELLLTGPTVPANSVKEFVALAKSKPGDLNYGSAGTGSNAFLMAELFKAATAINVTHVPYKGAAPAITAIMNGEVQLLFSVASGAMPHVQSGRIKALGITAVKRSPLRPELPTLAEQGVKGFETGVTYALLAPANTPRAIVTRLNQEIARIVASADVKEKLLAQSTESVGGSAEDCAEFIRSELAKWTNLAKVTGIRFD